MWFLASFSLCTSRKRVPSELNWLLPSFCDRKNDGVRLMFSVSLYFQRSRALPLRLVFWFSLVPTCVFSSTTWPVSVSVLRLPESTLLKNRRMAPLVEMAPTNSSPLGPPHFRLRVQLPSTWGLLRSQPTPMRTSWLDFCSGSRSTMLMVPAMARAPVAAVGAR